MVTRLLRCDRLPALGPGGAGYLGGSQLCSAQPQRRELREAASTPFRRHGTVCLSPGGLGRASKWGTPPAVGGVAWCGSQVADVSLFTVKANDSFHEVCSSH